MEVGTEGSRQSWEERMMVERNRAEVEGVHSSWMEGKTVKRQRG